MSKLSFKLHKNKDNTEILLYQIYLPKLHENILKYCRFTSFKEITISFIYGLQMILESSASLSKGLLV